MAGRPKSRRAREAAAETPEERAALAAEFEAKRRSVVDGWPCLTDQQFELVLEDVAAGATLRAACAPYGGLKAYARYRTTHPGSERAVDAAFEVRAEAVLSEVVEVADGEADAKVADVRSKRRLEVAKAMASKRFGDKGASLTLRTEHAVTVGLPEEVRAFLERYRPSPALEGPSLEGEVEVLGVERP